VQYDGAVRRCSTTIVLGYSTWVLGAQAAPPPPHTHTHTHTHTLPRMHPRSPRFFWYVLAGCSHDGHGVMNGYMMSFRKDRMIEHQFDAASAKL